jgi:hypothetical protein
MNVVRVLDQSALQDEDFSGSQSNKKVLQKTAPLNTLGMSLETFSGSFKDRQRRERVLKAKFETQLARMQDSTVLRE